MIRCHFTVRAGATNCGQKVLYDVAGYPVCRMHLRPAVELAFSTRGAHETVLVKQVH